MNIYIYLFEYVYIYIYILKLGLAINWEAFNPFGRHIEAQKNIMTLLSSRANLWIHDRKCGRLFVTLVTVTLASDVASTSFEPKWMSTCVGVDLSRRYLS